MQFSHLSVTGYPSSETRDFCLKLGYACAVIAMSPGHASLPMGYLRTVIAESIRQDRIRFYFNQDGRPVGYVIWASLSKQAESMLFRGGFAGFRREDRQSGESLWLVDLAAPLGNIKYVLRDLRDDLLRDEHLVRYFRPKNKQRVFKQIDRAMHCTFLQSA